MGGKFQNKVFLLTGSTGIAAATAEIKKVSVMGALNLYLDFINLFLMLLRLFGGRRN